MVSPGRYRELVRIERAVSTKNETGEIETSAWAYVAEVFAEALQPTAASESREVAIAGRDATELLMRFRLRTPVDVRAADRLIWNEQTFGVEGMTPFPAKSEIVVSARYLSGTDGR